MGMNTTISTSIIPTLDCHFHNTLGNINKITNALYMSYFTIDMIHINANE
jgi:fucose permease